MEDDKKLCPLKLQKELYFGDCNKEDCMWYCERTGDCAVTDIANHIRLAYSIALKIEDKYE